MQRQYWTDIGPCTRRSGFRRRFRTGQRHRRDIARHHSSEFAVNITCEFYRSGLGEIHAVASTQPPGLTLEIRPLHSKIAIFIDKAVPNIDINNSGSLGPLAIKLVQVAYVAARPGATNCRQPYPNNRYALALERRNHCVNALGVECRPLLGVEIVRTTRN